LANFNRNSSAGRVKKHFPVSTGEQDRQGPVFIKLFLSLFGFNAYTHVKQWFYENARKVFYISGIFVGKYIRK